MSSIPNLRNVDGDDGRILFWRGGQAPDAAAWNEVSDLGIDVVVKLNLETVAEAHAEKIGLRILRYPIDDLHQVAVPPVAQIEMALAALRGALDGGKQILVTCRHGQDWTGLLCALFRVRVQRWSPARAIEEAKALGFHPLLLGLFAAWEDLT